MSNFFLTDKGASLLADYIRKGVALPEHVYVLKLVAKDGYNTRCLLWANNWCEDLEATLQYLLDGVFLKEENQ